MSAPNILRRKIHFKSLVNDSAIKRGNYSTKTRAPFWFDRAHLNGFFIIRAH